MSAKLIIFFCVFLLAMCLIAMMKVESGVEVSANEDLMREHGILDRLLLIYDESISQLKSDKEFSISLLQETVQIMHDFIENYHEQLEEKYVFPRLKEAGKLDSMVDELLNQHNIGRNLTKKIRELATSELFENSAKKMELVETIEQFTRMYEAHAAREDTEIFPALHEILSPQEYKKLGDTFEDIEKQLFGKDGFETFLGRVIKIEKALGINELAHYNP